MFDGRRILWIPTLAGPVLCAAAYMAPGVGDDYRARAFIVTALAVACSIAMVADVVRGRGDGLRTRPALAAILGVNAAANAVRALHSLTMAPDFDMMGVSDPVLSITGLASLLAVVAANVVLMAMAKERAAAAMHRLADTDPLTGATARALLRRPRGEDRRRPRQGRAPLRRRLRPRRLQGRQRCRRP